MGTDEIEEVPADILVQRGHRNSSLSRRRAKSNSGINKEEEDLVDVTLDIQGNTVALHVTPVTGNNNHEEDEKLDLLGKGMEKKRSFGDSFVRTASNHLRKVSQELTRLTSFSKQVGVEKVKHARTESAASHALREFRFITNNDGDAGWKTVEEKFDKLNKDGLLPRDKFAECIGTA